MLPPKVSESLEDDGNDAVKIKMLELEYQLKVEEIRERERQREAEERERERQREAEERQKEAEDRQRQREYELEMKKLELAQQGKVVSENPTFDVGKVSRLVPVFQEKEVEKYFLHFEKIAIQLNWPQQYWTVLLQSRLVGKAHEAYAALPVDESNDYEIVKKAILKAYELVPEAY